jgi:mannosyltransferase
MSRADVRNVGLLVAFAALVHFPTLGVQSLGQDEAFTARYVLDPSLIDTLRAVAGESSPPLHYVLTWGIWKVFGDSEAALRAVSAIAATATAAVGYELGRTLVSRRVGLVLGALLAVNPMLFWFGGEARAYALLVLLSSASVLFFVKALDSGRRDHLALWAGASALALATHWFAGFLIAAEAVVLLARSPSRRDAALAVGATAAAMAILLPLFIHQVRLGGGNWIAAEDLGPRLRRTGENFVVGPTGVRLHAALPISLALLGVALVLLVLRGEGEERRAALLCLGLGAVAIALPLAPAIVGSDYFIDKNVLAGLVPLGVVVAAGLGARRSGAVGLAATVALVGTWLWATGHAAFDTALQRPGWRDVAHAVGGGQLRRAVLAPYNAGNSLDFYLPAWRQMKEHEAKVSEVVVFAWGGRMAPRLPHGFRLVQRRTVHQLGMERFRADRPRSVSRRELARSRLGGLCTPAPIEPGCEQGIVLLDPSAAPG